MNFRKSIKKRKPGNKVKGGPRGAAGKERVSGPAFLAPDLQDMSLVTLNTKTPRDFFAKHQLLLHVAKSEMDKVRVFQASRESSLSVILVSLFRPRTAPSHPAMASNS